MDDLSVDALRRALQEGRRDFTGIRVQVAREDDLADLELRDIDFSDSELLLVTLSTAFVGCKFERTQLKGEFSFGRFENCDFSTARLSASFYAVEFIDCRFAGASLNLKADECRFQKVIDFRKATITRSTFTKCDFSRELVPSFDGTDFGYEVTMDLKTFASLPPGSLTPWQESAIAIADDAALLRQSFSGLKRGLYLLLLFVFVAPYFLFVGREWIVGLGGCHVIACQPLYRALIAYVLRDGPFTVGTFAFVLLYQVVRTSLVAKASSLEVESAARHTRVRFELRSPVFAWWLGWRETAKRKRLVANILAQKHGGPRKGLSAIERLPLLRWQHLVWFVRWGMFVNVALLLLHGVSFLRSPVPQKLAYSMRVFFPGE